MALPLELYIAARYIKANIKQSFIVMFAVGIGVSLIVFIPSANMSFYGRMLERAVEKAPSITISREMKTKERNRQLLQPWFPGPEEVRISDKTLSRKRNILGYRTLMQRLAEEPDVVTVAPYVSEHIIVVRGSKVMGADLQGIVPNLEEKMTHISGDVEKGDLSDLHSNEVFLGRKLAEELGVDLGSRVQLVTSQGTRSFKVVGTLSTGLYAKDYSTVITSLTAAQKLLDMSSTVTSIGLRVTDPYQADAIAQDIRLRYGLKAESWMEQNKLLLDELKSFRVIISFISFLIVFAAASSITSILIMVVSSKSKEIGILKAMGAQPGQIMRLFMIQAMVLSLIGAVLGVFGGQGIIELYNASPIAKMESSLGFERKPIVMNIPFTMLAVMYAMISSFLASLLPAWQASRLNPVDAINK